MWSSLCHHCVTGELQPSSSALCAEFSPLEDNSVGTCELRVELTYRSDACGEWCVLELLELQNLLRKRLFFLW